MLINCPECNANVSDKAYSCPHCGFPFQKRTEYKSTSSRRAKVKRLPNGFGQISELKNQNLRKPFRVMVPVGKTAEGRVISKVLKPQGYFETYNEAYAALLEYNQSPYDLNSDLTVGELYEKWVAEYSKTLENESSLRTIKAAWDRCSSVYSLRAKELRARHIKACMDEAVSANIKARIKSMFNLMLDYALEYELVDKNYARTFSISENITKEVKKTKTEHIAFTTDEMESLWNSEHEYALWILFQCYTGWRPQELVNISLDDIDWDTGVIRGGMKTDVGKNRIVPICSKILPVAKKIKSLSELRGGRYLLTDQDGSQLTYDKYNKRFTKAKEMLGVSVKHRPHDPRKQFVTMCKKYNVDEYAIKRIVGHAVTDITENVYTERDIEWLKTEIEKISV